MAAAIVLLVLVVFFALALFCLALALVCLALLLFQCSVTVFALNIFNCNNQLPRTLFIGRVDFKPVPALMTLVFTIALALWVVLGHCGELVLALLGVPTDSKMATVGMMMRVLMLDGFNHSFIFIAISLPVAC